MKNLSIIFCLILCAASVKMVGQKAMPSTLKFSLYEPEDSIGRIVFEYLVDFEKYGHFGAPEIRQKNATYIANYVNLFDSAATVPNDITSDSIAKQPILIGEYAQLARKKSYRPYVLFIEKTDTTVATKNVNSDYYYTTIRFFKLFSDKAIIGDSCYHGAIYTVSLKINGTKKEIKITDIDLAENQEFYNFYLGNYGRHIYSTILVSNNLNGLVIPIPPPYVPVSTPTKSNFFVYAGYLWPNYLQPEAMRNNLNANYTFSGTEWGQTLGVQYQKTFGLKNRLGVFLGIEYEQNNYDFTHQNANFIYTEDQNGEALVDLEGTSYDKKYVDVASYKENGTLSFVKPEVGLLLNFGEKAVNFQLQGSVGNAFKSSATYKANAITSYQGQIDGQGGPISEDALGFYTDLEQSFSGDHTQVQNYMFYNVGAGLDIIMAKRIGLSFLVQYKNAFTYAIRKYTNELMFLDPDAGFASQLNTLSNSRTYNAVSVQVGLKIYLNELR